MAKFVTEQISLGLSQEQTAGTYEAPSLYLPIKKGSGLAEPKFDTEEFDVQSGFFGSKEKDTNTMFATIEESVSINLPATDDMMTSLFKVCGLSQEVVAGIGNIYRPTTNNVATASLTFGELRQTVKAVGVRGDLTITADVGKAVELKVDFKGMLEAVEELTPSDADNIIQTAMPTEKVYMSKDCEAYTINGNPAIFEKVELKLNATVNIVKATCGGGAYTSDWNPSIQIVVPLTEQNEASFDALSSGAEFSLSIPFFNKAGQEKWRIVVPKAVVSTQARSVDNGRLKADKTLDCRRIIGNDNFEIHTFQ